MHDERIMNYQSNDLMILLLFIPPKRFHVAQTLQLQKNGMALLILFFLCKIMFTPLTYNYLLTSGDKNFASEFQYATYEICFLNMKNDHKTNLRRKTEYYIMRSRGMVCINRRSKGGLSENHSAIFS